MLLILQRGGLVVSCAFCCGQFWRTRGRAKIEHKLNHRIIFTVFLLLSGYFSIIEKDTNSMQIGYQGKQPDYVCLKVYLNSNTYCSFTSGAMSQIMPVKQPIQ